MLTLKNISKSFSANYVVWLVFFILASNILLFTYLNSVPYVKSDGWRFIDIYLIPWNEGTLQLGDFFRDHHPQPLTAGLFIFNSEFFGLRMDYEALLGVIFVILSSFILVKELEKRGLSTLSLIVVAVVSMSLVSVNTYTWSLVTISYIGGFFGLLVIFYIDRVAKTEMPAGSSVKLFLVLLVFSIIFGTAAKIIYASIIAVFLVGGVFERKLNFFKLIALVILVLLVSGQFYSALGVESSYSDRLPGRDLTRVFEFFGEFLRFLGIGFLSAWGKVGYLKKIDGVGNNFIGLVGLTLLITYVATCLLFYYSKLYQKTKAPLILIMISFVAAVASWFFRYNPELQEPIVAATPRYYRHYAYGLIGVIWVWAEFARARTPGIRIVLNTMIVLLLVSHIVAAAEGWRMSKYIRKGIVDVSELMLTHGNGDYSKKPPRYVTGGNYPKRYKKGITYLKDNKLNVFMDPDFIEKYR